MDKEFETEMEHIFKHSLVGFAENNNRTISLK
jgi:hypothetical protein